MKIADSKSGYGIVSMINHWGIALFVVGMLFVGFTLSGMDRGPEHNALLSKHKAAGAIILVLASWCLFWRLRQGFPATSAGHPQWQALAAKYVHWFLLIALVVMPASGILWSLSGGRAISFFGLFSVPPLGWLGPVKMVFVGIHRVTAYVLAGAIIVHALAGTYHVLTDFGKAGGRMFTLRKD
jgi:cytochrome b561